MAEGQVTKIYQLKTLGYKDLEKQLTNVKKLFTDIKSAKNSSAENLFNASDAKDVKKYADELAKLTIEEQNLRLESQKLTNEIKAQQLIRQQAINDRKRETSTNKEAADSYTRLYKEYRELYKLVKDSSKTGTIDFKGQVLSYDEAIKKLKQLASAEQAFRRQFSQDGTLVGEYTTGIINAFKKLNLGDLVAGQITKAQDKIKSLNSDFDKLQKELEETKKAGKDTDVIERQMIENRKEVIALEGETKRLKAELRGFGDVGSQISASIQKGFQSLKGQLASFALQYVGIQALISQAQQGIGDAKLASDQTTDLEIQLGKTSKEADNLTASLAKLDTRTTVIGLQQIADIALKAGTSSENIAEVTRAFDVMKVAFGKDFGSIEQGVETTTKLINIFYNGQITAERILQIGNSIRALANETVASVPYLTDFSGRMAGLRQIANVSLPDILGLGAGFEEFKQSAEVASTVLVKVVPKLAEDVEKYAEIAGMTSEAFSNLLNNNPAEALIKVSEALVKNGKGIEEVSAAFADSELGSGRITTILATIGGKADVFRERIKRAGQTIQETGAIEDAFTKKNNNLAASMDKLGKKLTDAFSSKGFQATVMVFTTFLTFLLTNLPIVLGLLGLLTVSYLAQNAALLGLRAQVILYNLALGANYILMAALRVIYLGHIVVFTAYNAILKAVTATMRLFGLSATAASGPLGIIIALLGLLGTALLGINAATAGVIRGLDDQNRRMRALNEVNTEAAKIYTKQIAEIDAWVTVIKSSATSVDTKKRAVEELTKINKLFGDVVKDNVIDLNKLDEAYKKVTESIKAQAVAQASAELTAKKQQRLVAATALRQEIEITIARGGDFVRNTADVTGDEKEILKGLRSAKTISNLTDPTERTVAVTQKNFTKVINELKLAEEAANKEFQAYLEIKQKADADLQKFLADGTVDTTKVEVDIKKLSKDIEKLDKQIESFRGSKADLKKLTTEREKLQKELDNLLNRNQKTGRSYGGSKLSGTDKDLFKDIDALRDRQLTNQETRFLNLEIGEERYLKNIYAINVKALDAKIKLLDGSNAEERNKQAGFNLEKIKLEKELNDKLFEIRSNRLKDQLDITVKNAQEEADRIKNDPNSTETQKAQAQLDADKAILAAQESFNKGMDALEKQRNSVSKKNAEDRARELRQIQVKLNEDLRALFLANITDENTVRDRLMAEFQKSINRQREAILNSNKTSGQKKEALRLLDQQTTVGTLAREIAAQKALLPKYQKALQEKAITEMEYADWYQSYVNNLQALNDALASLEENSTTVLEFATNKLSKLFGFEQGSDQAKLFAETLSQSFDLAKTAMDNYYEAEKANIDSSLNANLRRLDLEKEQALARADSKEEEASINRQFAAKEEAANREAFEKNKKLQREQAKINLAIQLSNLAVIAFAPNPLNIATLGVAGAVMYGLQAAIALANYAMNISRINSAKYERGGVPTDTGGPIKGRSHKQGGVPFNAEAEDGEAYIVNKKSVRDNKVRTITGTNKQIASKINEFGGGVKFAAGAKVSKFERGGYIGQSLQAPIYQPSTGTVIATTDNSELVDKLDEVIASNTEMINATNERIDRLEVVQKTSTVTDAQKKRVKQTSIGTL